jgi:hypothetical protein
VEFMLRTMRRLQVAWVVGFRWQTYVVDKYVGNWWWYRTEAFKVASPWVRARLLRTAPRPRDVKADTLFERRQVMGILNSENKES